MNINFLVCVFVWRLFHSKIPSTFGKSWIWRVLLVVCYTYTIHLQRNTIFIHWSP